MIHRAGCVHFGYTFFCGFVTNVDSAIREDLQDFVQNYNLYPKFGVVATSNEERNLINSIAQYSSKW
jgi:hypothetical protein